jgi:predicted RNA-binding Zn-ribbon protein involved in translation (DUF1610 family)
MLLTEPVFIFAIIVWYGFNLREMIAAGKQSTEMKSAPVINLISKKIKCPNCGEEAIINDEKITNGKYICLACSNVIDVDSVQSSELPVDKNLTVEISENQYERKEPPEEYNLEKMISTD